MNRRKFLELTTTTGTGMLLTSPDFFSLTKPSFTMNKNFELKLLATNWGFNGSMDSFCEKAKKEGYDGIEMWWPGTKPEQDEMFAAIKKHKLEAGFLYGAWQKEPKSHFDDFKKVVDEIATQKFQRPLYINCHSGRDFFSFTENQEFIEYTNKLSADSGIPVYHETHRGRMMYAAHITRQFIEEYPGLRLTFDVSHWCNVHESLLEDQEETLTMAIERTDHIHARIGHQEGPQVNDPRANEWEHAVKAHFTWWDRIVEIKKKSGSRLTILTEFGPPNYMPTLPYTQQPLANQWDINVYMMRELRKRYG